jgi:hypothetical protein
MPDPKRPAQLAEAQPVSPPEPTDEQGFANFAAWLAREMPANTIIGDPLWWAPRIARAVLRNMGRPAPEPVSVACDAAWREFIEAVQHAQHVAKREGECPPFDLVETAFALWRSAAPEPVSVAERLPTASDCDGWGRCWHWDSHVDRDCWVLMPAIDRSNGVHTHWLPFWALPMPLPTTEQ